VNGDSPNLAGVAKDMLLEEYKAFTNSLEKSEQIGETRVNWFIGIVTAALAGLFKVVVTKDAPHGPVLKFIVIASLASLFVFGMTTLLRIIQRNKMTDSLIYELDLIREIFQTRLNEKDVLPKRLPFGRKPCTSRAETSLANKRHPGGLTDLVAGINSLLFAGMVAAVAFPGRIHINSACDLFTTYVSGATAFLAAFMAQCYFVRKCPTPPAPKT